MAVHTIDDLRDRLDDSLTWQRIELGALSREVSRARRLSGDSPAGLLDALGLDAGMLGTKQHLIDVSLCDVRNNVAHGKREFPSSEDYEALRVEVLRMMETLRDHLVGSMRAETFLTPGARTTSP